MRTFWVLRFVVPVVQRPRTPPFQGGNTGSNPVRDAIPLSAISRSTASLPGYLACADEARLSPSIAAAGSSRENRNPSVPSAGCHHLERRSPRAIASRRVIALHCNAWLGRPRCTRGGSLPPPKPASRRQRAVATEASPKYWTKSSPIISVRGTQTNLTSHGSAVSTPAHVALRDAWRETSYGEASEFESS